jgi:hypothetical protein
MAKRAAPNTNPAAAGSGHLRDKPAPSRNPSKQTGRADSTGGGQIKTGHLSERDPSNRARTSKPVIEPTGPVGSASMARAGDQTGVIQGVNGAGTNRIGASDIRVGDPLKKK